MVLTTLYSDCHLRLICRLYIFIIGRRINLPKGYSLRIIIYIYIYTGQYIAASKEKNPQYVYIHNPQTKLRELNIYLPQTDHNMSTSLTHRWQISRKWQSEYRVVSTIMFSWLDDYYWKWLIRRITL